ncbi:hypothetical protein EDD18DRAFT_1100856 [Armillaria luteobubalina]|uniref:Uncharacterized protein n=1 Tax=Armillaria luteobubalina TaxID=153913 RepID=A0AA39UTA5_9AGAR|nr:hypothetical protein EDD18DRAFT_1100856 [Armillaria luteobubalina]
MPSNTRALARLFLSILFFVPFSTVVLPQINARADLPSPDMKVMTPLAHNWRASDPGWTSLLVQSAQCYNSDVSDASDISHLSYNIYANIVGDCAWQESGCPITFQNYVDWLYGALSAVNATILPELVWFSPLFGWF